MPPGNPKWSLPPPEHKMVFVGRSASELCRQIKDPKQNGGRSLEDLLHHIADDDLVGWGWSPGEGRTLPPLSRPDTVAQVKFGLMVEQPVRSRPSNSPRLNWRVPALALIIATFTITRANLRSIAARMSI